MSFNASVEVITSSYKIFIEEKRPLQECIIYSAQQKELCSFTVLQQKTLLHNCKKPKFCSIFHNYFSTLKLLLHLSFYFLWNNPTKIIKLLVCYVNLFSMYSHWLIIHVASSINILTRQTYPQHTSLVFSWGLLQQFTW